MVEIVEHREEGEEGIAERVLDILKQEGLRHGVVFSRRDVWLEARVAGDFAGALSAKLGRTFMYVELLGVEAEARGRGVGRRLMERAEEIAREAGARGVWVDTFAFQAPGFYERLGYGEFGRIGDYVSGHDRIFYAKRFDGGERDG